MSAEVAVVIPTRNRSDLLEVTLRNLREQTHSALQIAVVDDASTDDTPALLQRLQTQDVRLVVHRLDDARGACYARNVGFGLTTAPFVCFLDSDDLMHPDKLAIQLEELERDAATDVVVCQMAHFESDPNSAEFLWNTFVGDTPRRRFLGHDPVWGIHAALWRREVLEKLGGFDETLPVAQEFELFLRALLRGVSFKLHSDLLTYCRRHGGAAISVSRTVPRLKTLERIFKSCEGLLQQGERSILATDFFWLAKQAGVTGDPSLAWRASTAATRFGLAVPLKVRLYCTLAAVTGRYRFVHWALTWADSALIDWKSRESWYMRYRIDSEPGLRRFEMPKGTY